MVVHPSTGHQNPSYLPQFSPIYFHLKFFPYIFISHIYSHPPLHIYLSLKNFFHTQIFSIVSIFKQFGKKFFYLPAKIPRILYHLLSKNPLILSLNKYSLSRIILEISLQLSHENYFPELLNPYLTILTYYVIIYYGNRNIVGPRAKILGRRPIYKPKKLIYLASNMLYIPFGASFDASQKPLPLYYSAKTSLKSLLKCLPIKLPTEHIRIDSRPKNAQYMSRKWNTAPFPLPPIILLPKA